MIGLCEMTFLEIDWFVDMVSFNLQVFTLNVLTGLF